MKVTSFTVLFLVSSSLSIIPSLVKGETKAIRTSFRPNSGENGIQSSFNAQEDSATEEAISEDVLPPSGFGDPHFRTYDGTLYSFHGQCDLVMARSYQFKNGLGLELHARTEIVDDWSLIKNAAIKIGKDVFELANDGSYYFNGQKNVEIDTIRLASKYRVSKFVDIVDTSDDNGNPIKEPQILMKIHLGDVKKSNKAISFQIWKKMILVEVGIVLQDTEGMFGIWGTTGMIGRDRETKVMNANDMGYQWQVRDNEPKLFHDQAAMPQFPHQCILPQSVDQTQRRLAKVSNEFIQMAEQACAHHVQSQQNNDSIKSFCIDDVIKTRKLSVAQGYSASRFTL